MLVVFVIFCFFELYSSRQRGRLRQLRAPSLLDSSGLVPLLLLPAPRLCDQEKDAVATFEACSSAAGRREPPHGQRESRDSQFGGDGAGVVGRASNAAFAVARLEHY